MSKFSLSIVSSSIGNTGGLGCCTSIFPSMVNILLCQKIVLYGIRLLNPFVKIKRNKFNEY